MRAGVNTLFLIPGEVGGTETYLRQTLLAIARHHDDIDLVLFTNNENDAVLRKDLGALPRVEFSKLAFDASNRYSRIIREQLQLPGAVARAKPDVLWSPGYTAPFFSACPQVVTIPDMQYKTYPQDMSRLARITTDILVKMAVARCRRIIAISGFSKNEIVRFTGARAETIDVTHLAADPVFGERIPESARTESLRALGAGDGPYILCVANTYPHKNVHALVEAFGGLMAEIPHRLVLIGKPRLGEAAVRAAVDRLPDKRRFCRIDGVSREQLAALYQSADLFVFPSLYEGFGLPVLEAMLAGTPVVAARRASIPEVGGDCVFYCEDGARDDLAAMIGKALGMTKPQRDEWRARAAAHAGTFSWQATASKTVASLKRATIRNA